MSDHFMNNQNALDILGEYADAIKDNRIIHKTYNEYLAMSQSEIDAGNFIITNVPTTHGKVQILDKLWENPDSSSTSQGQTIANIANIADYAFIILESYHTSLSGRVTHLKPVVFGQNSWIEFHNASGGGSAGGGQLMYRAVSISSSNDVTISTGHKVNTSGTDVEDNILLIPKAIYGLKTAVEVSAFIDQPANEIYSLNERRIGTWIDGKPLYQRTFTFTVEDGTAGKSQITDLTSWNIDTIIEETNYMRRGDNSYQHSLSWSYGNTSLTYLGETYYQNSTKKYIFSVGAAAASSIFDGAKAIVTLKYTKTTD